MSARAWEEYLAAARRLDAVRRGAAATASDQARAVQTAREELAGARARLAPQQSRLRDLGVPEEGLRPTPAEVTAAARAMAGGPHAVLAALRQVRATADAADAVMVGGDAPGGDSRPRLRNLLVYGPYALVVFVVQVALYLTANPFSPPALLWGLAMPVMAFGLGWVTVGLVYPTGPGGRIDRTPVLGAALCLVAPIMLTGVGAVVFRYFW